MGLVHSSGQEAASIPGEAEAGGAANRTAWVILGSSGQWSDWSQWPVAVVLDEQAAKDEVGRLSAAARELWAERPSLGDEDDWDEYEPLLQAWAARVTALDPLADEYGQPAYTAREVPLFSADAATAPDKLAGYEGEAGVNQNPAQPTPQQEER